MGVISNTNKSATSTTDELLATFGFHDDLSSNNTFGNSTDLSIDQGNTTISEEDEV